jgi:hypothetical protein
MTVDKGIEKGHAGSVSELIPCKTKKYHDSIARVKIINDRHLHVAENQFPTTEIVAYVEFLQKNPVLAIVGDIVDGTKNPLGQDLLAGSEQRTQAIRG